MNQTPSLTHTATFHTAIGAHILVSPLWLDMSTAWAELPLPQGPIAGGAALIWLVALLGGWLGLGIMLLVWARAGRGPVWSYPLRWALALSFTFLTLLAMLLPPVRRWPTPPRHPRLSSTSDSDGAD